MADGSDALLARNLASIDEIDAETWNALANPPGAPFNPFVSHGFLSALEHSQSVAPETGWAPMHLVLEEAGAVIAAAPLYAKGHSAGEYVFDHHWADAYARAGGRYYPKLLCAAPFTPVPGPRLLAKTDAAKLNLAAALRQIAGQMGASSAHVNFISKSEQTLLSRAGFLARMGEQFHWLNRGYETFDDFLGALSSRKRKAIRRERREAVADGVTIRRLVGDDITQRHWDAFWLFYQDTGMRKWGQPYLTRSFFRLIAESMGDRLLMIVAERDGAPIASALNFIGGDTLYFMAAIGDVWTMFPSCISSSATIKRSISRLSAALPASKRARKASIKSHAAMNRFPPIRRTGSAMTGSAMRLRATWTRNGSRRVLKSKR